jgi:hypothetical protein
MEAIKLTLVITDASGAVFGRVMLRAPAWNLRRRRNGY